MERIRKLEGRIRNYDWGSRHRLATLQGRPAPTAQPEAELWFGSHPLAPAHVEGDGGPVALDAWIARDAERCLGRDVVRRFGPRLPFLVKLLAVERPLSIQVHPDARRAREGFERESRAGLPLDAATRCYRDPHAKPELVCALEGFRALHGFRPLAEVAAHLAAAGFADLIQHFSALEEQPTPEAWHTVLDELLDLEPGSRRTALAGAADRVRDAGCDVEAASWVERLASAFPDDVWALAPLFLRFVVLEPGQGLFVPPGVLHGYLEGFALEAMASSDNVLRGGLTSKHVDRDELMHATDFRPDALGPWKPSAVTRTEWRYPIAAEEFVLSVLELEPDASFTCDRVDGAEILVCVAGAARARSTGRHGDVALAPGDAVLVPAAAGAYAVEGSGRVYRARVPAAGEGENA